MGCWAWFITGKTEMTFVEDLATASSMGAGRNRAERIDDRF